MIDKVWHGVVELNVIKYQFVLPVSTCIMETIYAESDEIDVSPASVRDILDSNSSEKTAVQLKNGDAVVVHLTGTNAEIMEVKFVAQNGLWRTF